MNPETFIEKIHLLGSYSNPRIHKNHVLLIATVCLAILLLVCLRGQIRGVLAKIRKACRAPVLERPHGHKAQPEPNLAYNTATGTCWVV